MKSSIDKRNSKYVSSKLKVIIPVMLIILAVFLILACTFGAVYIPFIQTVKIILKNLGILSNTTFPGGHEPIIISVRLPRVIIAALVGAALATSGAVMQGMFRNPMADPGILGVSSGAGLGAVIAIALGLTAKSLFYMPVFASIGALSAASVIFLLSTKRGKVPVLTIILAGIAVSTFIGAITSMILTFIRGSQVKEFLFWSIGNLSLSRWEFVSIAYIPIILGVAIMFIFARDLNVLMLGEEEAQAVGLNPAITRKVLLLLTSVTTAAAVCISGSISFVGLIVPHIMRLIVGPDHRILLPTSALGGAIFLVGCDLIARVVVLPYEIGVGIVTSLLGAPYFLFLLIRARKEGGVF